MKLLIARILFNLELNTVPRTVYTMNWNIKACKQMEGVHTFFLLERDAQYVVCQFAASGSLYAIQNRYSTSENWWLTLQWQLVHGRRCLLGAQLRQELNEASHLC